MGNLTRDPDVRVTSNGLSICKFGLAVNRSYTDAGGNKKDETTFVDLTAFGKTGEALSKYVSKGSPLFIEGRLNFSSWESNTGEKKSKLDVIIENFQFIGGKNENSSSNSGGGYDQSAPPAREQSVAAPAAKSADIDEDVPF